MSTGLESWHQNLLDIGVLYPFAGSEVLWVIIGVAIWILWHVIQYRHENHVYDEEEKSFENETKLLAAMKMSAAETLDEELKAHSENLK